MSLIQKQIDAIILKKYLIKDEFNLTKSSSWKKINAELISNYYIYGR
jgi:hypothetical protein